MGLADQLACEVVPCGVADDCLNSPQQRGEEQAECRHCKLANSGGGSLNYWRPWQRGLQHPKLIVEKREAGKARRAAAQEKRGKRDRAKMDVQRKARNAERQTNRSIIENTRNSGRAGKAGRAAAQEKRGKRDRAKMDVQRKARNAERQTNRSIIENTRNSGRIA